MPKVIIIGAGVGGLATANLLAKAGYDVHVYEKKKAQAVGRGSLKKTVLRLIPALRGT